VDLQQEASGSAEIRWDWLKNVIKIPRQGCIANLPDSQGGWGFRRAALLVAAAECVWSLQGAARCVCGGRGHRSDALSWCRDAQPQHAKDEDPPPLMLLMLFCEPTFSVNITSLISLF
jgi:hypothetical protein